MAVLFGLSQGQVSHWVGVLTPLVNAALERELLLPARRPADLEKLLANVPELRPLDARRQRAAHPPTQGQTGPARTITAAKRRRTARKTCSCPATSGASFIWGQRARAACTTRSSPTESGLGLPPDALAPPRHGLPRLRAHRWLHAPAPPRSRVDASFTPGKKPSTSSSAKCAWGVEHSICGVKRCRIVTDHVSVLAQRLGR